MTRSSSSKLSSAVGSRGTERQQILEMLVGQQGDQMDTLQSHIPR